MSQKKELEGIAKDLARFILRCENNGITFTLAFTQIPDEIAPIMEAMLKKVCGIQIEIREIPEDNTN